MTWSDYYKTMLALTMWREARGESREGMRAVGHVIRNRMLAGWGDWDHVITAKWQFSSLTAPRDSQLIVWPDSPDSSFELAMQLANDIYLGNDSDITGKALYYRNAQTATSEWFQKHVANKMCKTATIGHHEFYAP